MQKVPERPLDSASQPSSDELSRRYKVLLHVTDVAARRGFPDLLQELSQRLRELFDFNFLNYSIRDDQADLMRLHMVDEELQAPQATGSSSNECCAEWVWSQQQTLVISDMQPDTRFQQVLDLYGSRGFHSLVILPMTTARRRLGALCLGSVKITHYDDEVLYFLERLASLVGLALETTLSLDVSVIKQALRAEEEHMQDIAALRRQLSERSAEAHEALRREQEQLETILQIQGALVASRANLHQMFPAITGPRQAGDHLPGVSYLLGSPKNPAEAERTAEKWHREPGMPVESGRPHQTAKLEKERLHTLLEMSRTLTFGQDSKKLLQDVSACVRRLTAQDCAYLTLYDATTGTMQIEALDFPGGRGLITAEGAAGVSECPAGIAIQTAQTRLFSTKDLEEIGSDFTKKVLAEDLRWICCLPLISERGPLGSLNIASKKEGGFSQAEIELLQQVAGQVAIAVDTFRVGEEISNLKGKIAKQAIAIQQGVHGAFDLQEIVGKSRALANVLQQVKTVAPSVATVLILGETGTGKELVARAIHKLSPRSAGNFVKLNCAAIPTGLLESELFGHEKGAFTGAVSQKIGRLELAHNGTMFLDEVGEIPLELQPKLLRVLQDQEFERLGGTRTIRVQVRILAATNREISKAVANHEFRSDLYYRLHVFPIRLPALRQRSEDIPMLVHYFVQKFATRMNKSIESIPAETMEVLRQWHWPGNVRELENFMERSVILTDGPSLRVPVDELGAIVDDRISETPSASGSISPQGTLEELERQYIVQVLRQSAGVISGSHGAAARLGMKRTTLQSKMQRLGITREEYAS
ncbi:MAG: sigma 54-interacting transcriptional regulator [Terriglobales bacterium]